MLVSPAEYAKVVRFQKVYELVLKAQQIFEADTAMMIASTGVRCNGTRFDWSHVQRSCRPELEIVLAEMEGSNRRITLHPAFILFTETGNLAYVVDLDKVEKEEHTDEQTVSPEQAFSALHHHASGLSDNRKENAMRTLVTLSRIMRVAT